MIFWGVPTMKMTDLSILCKWENLKNRQCIKYLFAPLYINKNLNWRVCVCVCGHVYVVYEDTNLYNDIRHYDKEKVIYEDIFSVPII